MVLLGLLLGATLSMLLLLPKRPPEKRAATGESAGKGLRRTGDWVTMGAGAAEAGRRKEAKDEMAIEDSDGRAF